MNAHGNDKVDGINDGSSNIASQVDNDMRIKIVLILEKMASWTTKILDVKKALLYGEFIKSEESI